MEELKKLIREQMVTSPRTNYAKQRLKLSDKLKDYSKETRKVTRKSEKSGRAEYEWEFTSHPGLLLRLGFEYQIPEGKGLNDAESSRPYATLIYSEDFTVPLSLYEILRECVISKDHSF
ncbi:hypothetical protein CMI41_01615 [Candidatus Pacearchaeota archaeon]|nr:hypothetical protein [Candidatus Pacearchaeota archaeon]|tara:strand:+ start:257 stop:613 length:357 start_codon:yes stop_codon:yes gene_type:complete